MPQAPQSSKVTLYVPDGTVHKQQHPEEQKHGCPYIHFVVQESNAVNDNLESVIALLGMEEPFIFLYEEYAAIVVLSPLEISKFN